MSEKVISKIIDKKQFDKNILEAVPAVVYKFRDWSIKYHRDLLNCEFYFSSPLQFNDPFDLNIPVAYELLRENKSLQRQYFIDFVGRSKSDWTKLQKQKEVDRLINEGMFNDDKWLEWQGKNHKREYDNVGVFCFSKNKSEILSWSHYSNSHQGFCIGFNAVELFTTFLSLHGIGGGGVNYVEEYPLLSPLADFDEQLITQLTYKSKKWDYEQEIRVFKLYASRKIYSLPVSIIKEINLGCSISELHKNEIVSFVRNTLSHVKLYQASTVRGKYELAFKEI